MFAMAVGSQDLAKACPNPHGDRPPSNAQPAPGHRQDATTAAKDCPSLGIAILNRSYHQVYGPLTGLTRSVKTLDFNA